MFVSYLAIDPVCMVQLSLVGSGVVFAGVANLIGVHILGDKRG